MTSRALVLGGTAEAVEIANCLVGNGWVVVTSLAGRTRGANRPQGAVRVGGFGGAVGLAAYLAKNAIDVLIDATHPFAERISANAERAASEGDVARAALLRPAWPCRKDDRWHRVASLWEASSVLPTEATVLLALGRQHLAPFGHRADLRFVVRSIEPVEADLLPSSARFVLSRPSADPKAEATFLRANGIEWIISRNSGGVGAFGKIEAARDLGLPVVMIDRPKPPEGPVFETVDDIVRWAEAQRQSQRR